MIIIMVIKAFVAIVILLSSLHHFCTISILSIVLFS